MKRTRASDPKDYKVEQILLRLTRADMDRLTRMRLGVTPVPAMTVVLTQALREFLDRWERDRQSASAK